MVWKVSPPSRRKQLTPGNSHDRCRQPVPAGAGSAGQTGVTLTDVDPIATQTLLVQAGDQRHTFHTDFIAGRQGTLAVSDEYASNHHASFQIAHGLWYVKDLGSTNGTWLNGRRIHAPQRVKRGDKIKIGHTGRER